MKKIFACATALSLMLVACGDDASSTSPKQSTGGEKKTNAASSYHPGKCLTEIACAKNEDGKAYLISGENGGYQLVVQLVPFPRSAWIEGDFFSERSGDTLYVWDEKKDSDGTISMQQPCVADLVFDISAEDADIKFFKHFDDVYEVVPGPVARYDIVCNIESSSGMNNPASSGAVESSSSQGASSAVQPGSSSGVTPPSSSSRQVYNGPVPLKSITATCQDKNMTDVPVVPPSPTAYLSVSNSFAQIDLFNVNLTYACDSASQMAFWDSLKAGNTVASVIGDTLFVNFKRFDEKGVEYKCGCTAKVEFTFDERYAGFGYTAFENNRPPLELGHRLVNQPDPSYQKIEKADAQCVNNDPTEDPLTDAAIPPVAHMHVNGDSAQIVIESVEVVCGTEIESVEIQVRDSMLYVTPYYDPASRLADCICSTKISFNVKALDLYKEATLLVYDDGSGFNLSNKMRLIVE